MTLNILSENYSALKFDLGQTIYYSYKKNCQKKTLTPASKYNFKKFVRYSATFYIKVTFQCDAERPSDAPVRR